MSETYRVGAAAETALAALDRAAEAFLTVHRAANGSAADLEAFKRMSEDQRWAMNGHGPPWVIDRALAMLRSQALLEVLVDRMTDAHAVAYFLIQGSTHPDRLRAELVAAFPAEDADILDDIAHALRAPHFAIETALAAGGITLSELGSIPSGRSHERALGLINKMTLPIRVES
ncbi:hypothetical protein BN1110_06290 [bacterium YEK0313]|nr:hypothetical protein BN1110_06290 [bacterium YEK0313]